jgi:hypothetical protein
MTSRSLYRRALGVATGIALAGTLLTQGASPAPVAAQAAEPPTCGAPGGEAAGTTWAVDADNLRVDDPQETRRRRRWDEVYIANVSFRSTPGVAGSTEVCLANSRYKLSSVGPAVENHAIRDEMGRVEFPDVTMRDLVDIVVEDANPEIFGTFTLVFEQDNTPSSAINGLLRDIRDTARREIAALVEPMDLFDSTNLDLAALAELDPENTEELLEQVGFDPSQLAADMERTAERVEDRVMPRLGERLRIFFRSRFNPDDLIGFKVNLFVALTPELGELPPLLQPFAEQLAAEAVGPGDGIARLLAERSYPLEFRGSDATYTLDYRVEALEPEPPVVLF